MFGLLVTLKGVKRMAKAIIALDFSSIRDAKPAMDATRDYDVLYKFGLEMIHAEGLPKVMRALGSWHGTKRLFADTKLHDIPNTMAGAARNIGRYDPWLFNVMAQSGRASMQEAVANKGGSLVAAVTILTSIPEGVIEDKYRQPYDRVIRGYAVDAINAGVDAIICAGTDIALFADIKPPEVKIICPGSRPVWYPSGDQKRVMTPGEMVKAGADYIVLGRAITQPPPKVGSVAKAWELIRDEMEEASSERATVT